MTHFSTRLKLTAIVSSFVLFFQSIGFSQNIDVPSTWDAYGATATAFENAFIDTFQMHFVNNSTFMLTYYDASSTQTQETGSWIQSGTNQYKISFDGSGSVFSDMCPNDTVTIYYHISGSILTMDSTSGNCTTLQSFLNQTTWQNATASIDENTPVNFELYPNPAKETLTVQFNDPNEDQLIEMTTIDGSKVNVIIGQIQNGRLKMDVSNLPAGTYLLRSGTTSKLCVVE